MKKISLYLISFAFGAAYAPNPATPHTITFFMIPCGLNPACAKKFPYEDMHKILGSSELIAQEILRKHLASPLVQGIYVNYLGYLTYSDYNGQVVLPNKESNNKLTVVVADAIYPVLSQGNTVHHFEIPEHTAAAFYEYTLHDDEQHKKWHWSIKKQDRPKGSRIPTRALIIMAHPEDIEITPGTFPTHPDLNFILPDIYVHSSIHTPATILRFLKNSRFFEPLTSQKAFQDQSYTQAVQP